MFCGRSISRRKVFGQSRPRRLCLPQKTNFRQTRYVLGGTWPVLQVFLMRRTGDPANKVKNGTLSIDKRTMVGKALDRYKYFKEAEWKTPRLIMTELLSSFLNRKEHQ